MAIFFPQAESPKDGAKNPKKAKGKAQTGGGGLPFVLPGWQAWMCLRRFLPRVVHGSDHNYLVSWFITYKYRGYNPFTKYHGHPSTYPVILGGAIWVARDDSYFPHLNEELTKEPQNPQNHDG